MSKEKFIRNSLIYTLGDMLPKVISFFMLPLVTAFMTPKENGIYGTVATVMGFFSMFYLLGLDGALTRFYYNQKNREKQREFISTIWIFLFCYNLLTTLLLYFFGERVSGLVFKNIAFDPYFKLMVVYCFFTTFTAMPMVLFRLKEEALRFGVFNILTTIVNIAFFFYFVVYRRDGAKGYLSSYVCTSIVFSLIYLLFTFKDLKFKFSPGIIKEGLKYGIPLIPHAIGGWVLMVSDRWFMERYGLLEELGIYTVAYQLGLLVYYFLGAVNKAYVPFFFKTAEEDKNAKSVFEDIIKYYSVLILSIGLGLSIFSREIITLMVTNKAYYGAIGVIPVIALAYTVDGYYYMSVNGIFYSKKTQILALTTGITAVSDIILNALLIPRFGMYGAAFATTIAYTILFILTYIVSQRYYYIKWHWNVIFINVILVGAAYYLGTLGPAYLWTNFAYKVLIYFAYVAALFILKILSYDKLKLYGAKILKR